MNKKKRKTKSQTIKTEQTEIKRSITKYKERPKIQKVKINKKCKQKNQERKTIASIIQN